MSFCLSEHTQRLRLTQPFGLESGVCLDDVVVAYRTWGKLNASADNAVIVCHALTGSADADNWWADLFGQGKTLDPKRYFIVCSNVLGGCYGTTGATSLKADAKPWGADFPAITIRDQVRLQMRLADYLGIQAIQFVIGGSMGGLQALEWGLLDRQRVQAVISIAASGRHSAWCMGWSEAQRLALQTDPLFQQGRYEPAKPPAQGLKAARAIAMLTYRSPQSCEVRFGRHAAHEVLTRGDLKNTSDSFAINAWLHFHGDALAARFDANSYLSLLNAMDTHDLSRGRGEFCAVLKHYTQPILIGSVVTDALYVPAEQQQLANALPNAQLFQIHSSHGHDGFLIDAARFEPIIRQFVQTLAS
jgi:homoserine O-acetyltransferase